MVARKLLVVVVVALGVGAMSGAAEAQARHERVVVKPINKGGKVIGARINLWLRPDKWNAGFSKVRVSLGANDKAKVGADYRKAGSDPKAGYIRKMLAEESGVENPTEKSFEVLYGDGNDLQGGDEVDVMSAWNKPDEGNSYGWHIWGLASSYNDATSVIKLPGGPAAAKPAAPPAAPAAPAK